MAQTLFKLNPKTVAAIKKPGRHSDGGSLYLAVSKTAAKSWIFLYKLNGKQREMGLGSLNAISLAEARKKAEAARNDIANRIDPLDKRNAERSKPKAKTFGECAEDYIESHKTDWKNSKHGDQWLNSLTTHAGHIWKMPVNEIDTADIVAVLKPIWTDISETARRVRGRIETVLDSAKALEYRSGENPARWRGHLDKILAKKRKETENFASLHYKKLPQFMEDLRTQDGVGARALEFLILTVIRTQGIIANPKEGIVGALWSEIDFDEATWTIPKIRMKTPKDYVLPLPARAMEILKDMQGLDPKVIFPGTKAGQSISSGTMSAVLRRMGVDDATVHGFRATFRTWVGDKTVTEKPVSDMALAHTISDKVEAAYNRAELMEKRRILSNLWANYCAEPPAGKVVAFGKKAS
jgi:integrase